MTLNLHLESQKDLETNWLNLTGCCLNCQNERHLLRLNRLPVIQGCLQQILRHPEEFGRLKKLPNRWIVLETPIELSVQVPPLSFYRMQLIHGVLNKLLDYSQWQMVKDSKDTSMRFSSLHLRIESVHNNNNNKPEMMSKSECKSIKCGIVNDPLNGGKPSTMNSKDYIE